MQPAARCTITGSSIVTPLHAREWAAAFIASEYPDMPAALTLVVALRQGVDLGYTGQRSKPACGNNLPTADEHASAIDADMQKQCALGRRAGPLATMPFPFYKSNPLGVVFKKSDVELKKPRVIHHLSWPRNGDNVNASVLDFDVELPAFDEAIAALRACGRGSYMTKIDIEAAYRCIPVRPSDWPLQAMRWRGQFYYDIVMQFGLASATAIFEWYSSAAQHFAKRLLAVQYLVHYIDDFMMLHASQAECTRLLDAVLALFARLGLPVAADKRVEPAQLMVFLGVLFDTINMTLSLEEKRMTALLAELASWRERTHASRKELQQLIGTLAFAAKVVRPGRMFLRRMLDQLKRIPSWASSLKQYPLSPAFKLDVAWWSAFARDWNGKSVLLASEQWQAGDASCVEVHTDACTTGWGAVHGMHWIAGSWSEDENATAKRAERDSMPWKELHVVVRAAATWGPGWAGKHVLLHSDCDPVVKAWKKGDSPEPAMAALLRTLWFLCAKHDFTLTIQHIAGADNVCADLLSRTQIRAFLALQPPHSPSPTIHSPVPTPTW
jgi:hypothetical protein